MEEAPPAVVYATPQPLAEDAPAAPAAVALPPRPAREAHAAAEAAAAAARDVYQTTKKRDAVVVDGYVMLKHFVSSNGRVQHWRCEKVNVHSCRARGESVAGTPAVVMKPGRDQHNHERSATALKVRKLQTEVKDQARRLHLASAANIVDEAMRGADGDVVLAVQRDNLLRVANNARRLEGARHVNRGNVADIDFPDAFKTTAVGDQFLLVDSRRLPQPPTSVFFIFASPVQLRELRQRHHWAVDGTFYCTPTHFDSVFTIHVHVGHSSLPVAYFLLQDRKETTYKRALTAFLDAANLCFVQPASIMSDFEVAAINALRATFPAASIRLCLFHLAQSAFRNIAELGLVRLYRDNARAQEMLRCFPALAAVPPEDVVEGLHVIVDELTRMLVAGDIDRVWEPQIAEFEDYFERTYIRKLNRLGDGFEDPRYPVASWNHYHAILNNQHRTNNAVEGKLPGCWHHAFNNTFSASHMALDKFIYRMKNDEDITRQRLLRHEVLPADPIRRRRLKRYLVADKHLLALTQRYATYRADGEVLRYLRCVQHHLQKPRFPGEPANVNEDPLEEVADDDNGGDGAAADGDGDDGDRIPRRESHPGGHHGFEPELAAEERGGDQVMLDGGAVEGAGGGANVAVDIVAAAVDAVNGFDEFLPGFSQASVVANRPPVVHWGPVQLPSQSAAGPKGSTSAAAAPRRNPGRVALSIRRDANGSF